MLLYIPIWLYSNIVVASVMLSSILLYIPIWLYSNCSERTLNVMLQNLYIPIWLYSNGNATDYSYIYNIFTFQSGYIQIVTIPYAVLANVAFTFQSGYIQIKTVLDRMYYTNTLHSNLVIFKWIIKPKIQWLKWLYIPIWLYSNPTFTHSW